MRRRHLAGLVAALALTAGAATAAPPSPTIANRYTDVVAHLEARGYPVDRLPLHVEDIPAVHNIGADGLAFADRLVLDVVWAREGERDNGDPGASRAVHILMHEALHTVRATKSLAHWDQAQRALEEGIVEAVARDETTDYVMARFGWFYTYDGSYDAGVRMVRGMSARATGYPWQAAQARQWRKQILIADDEGRARMWEAANAPRMAPATVTVDLHVPRVKWGVR